MTEQYTKFTDNRKVTASNASVIDKLKELNKCKIVETFNSGNEWDNCGPKAKDYLMMTEQEMQEKDKWISVDTPPKEGGRYLAVVKELNDLGYCTYVWNCCYQEVENRWSDNLKDMTVTHWQPLPSPPKTK